MDLDKFLKSQTFKTGAFVLLVLFVLLIVFKLGVVHGYKKAHFSHTYGFSSHRIIGEKFFGHQKGMLIRKGFEDYSIKDRFIKTKVILDSTAESESVEDLTE